MTRLEMPRVLKRRAQCAALLVGACAATTVLTPRAARAADAGAQPAAPDTAVNDEDAKPSEAKPEVKAADENDDEKGAKAAEPAPVADTKAPLPEAAAETVTDDLDPAG